MTDLPTVPCMFCGKPTAMLGTKKCDRCWELHGRLQFHAQFEPAALKKITASLGLEIRKVARD